MNNSVDCNTTNNNPTRDWCVKSFDLNHIVMCYGGSFTRKNGVWRVENAAMYALPTFLVQIILIISINRLLMGLFKYLHLPRITAEILGGVILGCSGVPFITVFARTYIFPFKSIMTLETIANLGLLFYMFLVGLEVDIKPIIQAPKKAFSIALAGFLVPFPVGYALNYFMIKNFDPTLLGSHPTLLAPLFWGIVLSTTNFPELAQILSDFKLLRSEVGRTALSAAIITDFISWVILIVSMGIVNSVKVYTSALAAAFVLFALLVMRPALALIVRQTRQSVDAAGGYNDYHLSFILVLVLACGYVTDMCGCRSILGGFMLGIIIPRGDLKEKLTETVEAFVPGFMMPLFFCLIGMRTTFDFLFDEFSPGMIVMVLISAFVVKIASAFVVAVFINKDKVRDGLALGVLMNTKGLLSLIVICTARDYKVLDNQTFTLLVMALWLMTVAVGPILSLIYKSSKPYGGGGGNNPTIGSLEPDSEFRVLTCFHSPRELAGIINLLDTSNPTRNSPINVSAVHLVENVGRATAIRIVRGGGVGGSGVVADEENDLVSAYFETLKFNKEPGTVSVVTLAAVSEYATMHVDVCSLAREHSATLVVLPFQSPSAATAVASSETNTDFTSTAAALNKNIMERLHCSAAVLVDRGSRPPSSRAAAGRHSHLLMIFVGGADDREALEYAGRMSASPGLTLTVARFAAAPAPATAEEEGETAEKMLDERCVEEFCRKTRGNKMVGVRVTEVGDGDEMVKAVMAMDGQDCFDLIIVGRGRSGRGQRLASLEAAEWSEFPELGSLGDSLVGSNFAENAWILVVQQGGG